MGWRKEEKNIIITLEFFKFNKISDRNKKYRCTRKALCTKITEINLSDKF